MAIRTTLLAAAALILLGGCRDREGGPIVVSAIGQPPTLGNPNLKPLDAASSILTAAVAQGLVRFDPAGQIEPALAQSWTVSDDGLSYIFRIERLEWANGQPVTAEQVAARLRAAISRASKNRLKPVLGSVAEILAMTERVIEIRLKSPRPTFLQLLAQPEMAIIRNGEGTGPLRAEAGEDGAVRLTPRPDEEATGPPAPDIILRGEGAALAVARFVSGGAALVVGGTAGDLPIALAADPPGGALRFDPVAGLFGLEFTSDRGFVADPEARRALSMALDRAALVAGLGVPDLAPRETLLPTGIRDLPAPAAPAWVTTPLPARRAVAATIIGRLSEGGDEQPKLRVAMPDGPGYRLIFAYLRRDWRAIGVDAERVGPGERADLRLVDAVAPANLASWYLRRFACDASPACSEAADALMETARNAPDAAGRQRALAEADVLLNESAAFIPIAAPVRWSLVSPRLTGFQANPFARHFAGSLLAARP